MLLAGVALAVLLGLAIFCMLVMARKQEEDQDRLEIELRRQNYHVPHGDHEKSSDNISVSVIPDLRIDASKPLG